MVLNAAVQMIREAEELKQNILKFKSDTSMLQERSLWSTQQQLQRVRRAFTLRRPMRTHGHAIHVTHIYQKVLVLDLDYALDKKVEQDLWNVGFKQQIEALQNISKDRKNPLRSEGQAMLSWVLQAAAGFYLCLLHQICTAFKLDLPFRRRASLLGWVEGWSPGATAAGARLPPPAAARYICQHCLVHLGDLARYRQQPRVAYTFYRHALVVSTHSGQPYNQLGLLARRRGRRLGALYWHVRAVLVRAPFPPAPNNLLRTLQQHASHAVRDAPVLPGLRRVAAAPAAPLTRLDTHAHVTELMRALYMIHTLENLEFAGTLVDILNTSLTSLVATDCFESMTLIKMVCVIIWLVHSSTEDLTVTESSLSAAEASAAALSETLAAGALLALLLPAHTADAPPARALPALKVFLAWVSLHPQLLRSAPFVARPQLWHALAHTLNKLRGDGDCKYDTVPLPEDEELHGFQPLEQSFKDLKFLNHATWDTYGRHVPDVDEEREADEEVAGQSVVTPASLSGDPEQQANVRAHRLVGYGKRLADLKPEHLTYSTEDGVVTFSALCLGGEELSLALAELQASSTPHGRDSELDSEDEAPLPPPIVISEADFREKVREKRVGILKPQGSLERAREERALATTDDQLFDASEDCTVGGDRREVRRPRVNIAMAAILRKQEETCKQVKFRTPPPTLEDTKADTISRVDSNMDRPKVKQQKSLADIPVGRKTGGILALKDKSGYPHLVNVGSEVVTSTKPDEPQQRDPKVIQPPAHTVKRDAPQYKWHQPYELRPSHRNYGLNHAGIRYKPNYDAPATVTSQMQSIRLPVVNPKEIDVRSAALQRQSGRSDFVQRPNYVGDKKSFMDDLPPRFANQRWNQEQDNKFRDDFQSNQLNTSMFTTPPPSWLNPHPLQMPPQLPLQSQLPNQLSQMSMPPPPLPDSYAPPSWWERSPYNTSPSRPDAITNQTVAAMQQLYNTQMSNNVLMNMSSHNQMPSMSMGMTEPLSQSYVRQSPIGQPLPPRHISPPSFNPFPVPALPYANPYTQYQSRDYLGESRYQPTLPNEDYTQETGLDLTIRKPKSDFAPYSARRMEEGALERAMDEALKSNSSSNPSTEGDEQEEAEAAAEDPGTYSLFSAAPGACDWGVAQRQQGRSNANV